MQYLGGKSRIAKQIASVINERAGDRDIYIEPFLGAGSVALQLSSNFKNMILADVVPDLVMLWNAVISGWEPPSTLTVEEYKYLKTAEPSALRAFAGFPCSFGGKWFGGYAKPDPRMKATFIESARRSLIKRGKLLNHAVILNASYEKLDFAISARSVVYADPPYAGTTSYGAAGFFDSEKFWSVMQNWVEKGALVFVSEYSAPKNWTSVWSASPPGSLAKNHGSTRVSEHLFMFNGNE